MGRVIGIRHRIKKTAEGEARPTQVCILDNGEMIKYNLSDETSELDWARGRFPVEFRPIEPNEDPSVYASHHIKWRKLKKGEDAKSYPQGLLKQEGKQWSLAVKVPAAYDGLRENDTVAMVLGGSGDNFAFALSRRGEEIGASIYRIPPFKLKARRTGDKSEDAQILAELARDSPGLFYLVMPRDRNIIHLRVTLKAWKDTMKDRIACEQRIRQRLVGEIFRREDGLYPEGDIEVLYQEAKANSAILQDLLDNERDRLSEMTGILEGLDIYTKILRPVKGMGPRIGARLIAAIQDICRFKTASKLKKYCGVHVLDDGRFPRDREGELSDWRRDARQALFLLGDQFNRRPKSLWGQKLLVYKKNLCERHPKVEIVNGKKRYTNVHIHKMGLWRARTRFIEWLWREWWRLEKERTGEQQSRSTIA